MDGWPQPRRARDDGSAAADLVVALEAQLTEQRERTAELEERLRRLERRLAEPVAVELPPPAPSPGPTAVRSIDSWRWDEGAEWGYWLRACEGFRVRDSSGLLGVVDSIRFGCDLELPETLIVSSGRRGRRRRHIEVAVSELSAVDPDARQITLAVPAREWLLPPAPRRRLPWSRSLERAAPLL